MHFIVLTRIKKHPPINHQICRFNKVVKMLHSSRVPIERKTFICQMSYVKISSHKPCLNTIVQKGQKFQQILLQVVEHFNYKESLPLMVPTTDTLHISHILKIPPVRPIDSTKSHLISLELHSDFMKAALKLSIFDL